MGSWGAIYNNTLFGIRYHTRNMTRLQEQAATGSRVVRSSDDPADASRIMSLQDDSLKLTNYTNNLTEVELSLQEGANAVQTIAELFTRVDVLVTQASSGTYMEDNREAIGEEIDQILQQTLSLANHSVMGRFIFGGADSWDKPYEATVENNRLVNVRYAGSRDEQPVPVGPGITMSGQMVGEHIFRNDQRQPPVITGQTGARPGTGTSTARGDQWLTLTHTLTTYQAGSGLAMGTGGAAGDTILGNAHTITVDTASQTLKLDNGQTVTYNGTETDLRVENEHGDVIYVDTTGALADGIWTIEAEGEIQIGDGPGVALTDFTEDNLAVPDPFEPDRFLYVNCIDIQRIGTDSVQIPGTHDVFGALIHIRDLLLNDRDLATQEQLEALSRSGEAVRSIGEGFRQRMTIIGGRLGGVDSLRKTLDDLKFNTDSEATAIQQADITEVATDLARTQTLYQMSIQIAAKTINLTLLDFIR
jgi:flagellar hook-associated protein 3 FlgL